ncbi:hypothetical protein BJ912DRAFT_419050 [Pholiota molesta]|nr:hypothetical protein BJ912DRAFT_419050 [Pholiota molesta]
MRPYLCNFTTLFTWSLALCSLGSALDLRQDRTLIGSSVVLDYGTFNGLSNPSTGIGGGHSPVARRVDYIEFDLSEIIVIISQWPSPSLPRYLQCRHPLVYPISQAHCVRQATSRKRMHRAPNVPSLWSFIAGIHASNIWSEVAPSIKPPGANSEVNHLQAGSVPRYFFLPSDTNFFRSIID